LLPARNTPSKRKRDDSDTEADAHGLDDAEDNTSAEEDEREEEEYSAPKSRPTGSPKGQSKTKPKPTSPTKATSKAKASTKAPKATTRKHRKDKQGQDTFDATKVASETKIDGNNSIFSPFCAYSMRRVDLMSTLVSDAIMNPSAALQSIAEDFLDSLSQTPGPAQAELINCVLRACGCNNSVNEDEALDYDGVLDSLDNFTENLKQVCFPSLSFFKV
jgi:cohesin complex subunit SA-1/2